MKRPRVLVTRSPHQASELADRLRMLGCEPVLIPTIELIEPSSFAALDAALVKMAQGSTGFHWLVFTSANAVAVFHNRRMKREEAPAPWPALQVAAIGPATARALEAAGRPPDLVAATAVAESLAAALLPYARQPDGSATRLLLVRAEVARDLLPDTLRAAGAEVTIAPAYRNQAPADSMAQLQTLFDQPENWPDAITFTSSSTAYNLQALLAAAGVALPLAILRVSIGPITSQTLRSLDFPPHAEAAEPTVRSLAQAVADALLIRKPE